MREPEISLYKINSFTRKRKIFTLVSPGYGLITVCVLRSYFHLTVGGFISLA